MTNDRWSIRRSVRVSEIKGTQGKKPLKNGSSPCIFLFDLGSSMNGIASSLAKPAQLRSEGKPRPRSEAKRARIVEVAIRHFAERGSSAARVEDIAAQLGIAKGSV